MNDDRVRQLYVAHGSAIFMRCLRLLGDPAAAEDATQEIFLKLHSHLNVPEGDIESLRWVYRVATNLCLKMLRDRKPNEELTPELPSGQHLEEALAQRDLARRIILSMPEKLRLPAWLHHVDGLGLDEVAAVLGISPRTAFTRVAAFRTRALKLFQQGVA